MNYILIFKCTICNRFGVRFFNNIKLDYYVACEYESWEVGQLTGGN